MQIEEEGGADKLDDFFKLNSYVQGGYDCADGFKHLNQKIGFYLKIIPSNLLFSLQKNKIYKINVFKFVINEFYFQMFIEKTPEKVIMIAIININ